jgi:hypothetical protein
MSKRWLILLGILGLCGLGSEERPRPVAPEPPRWLTEWEEGRKAARASGKPLFVVFRCEH